MAQQRPAGVCGGHCGRRAPQGWWLQGEKGNSETENFQSLEAAKKWFETKFRKKTKNAWAQRHCFKPHPGKYKLIEEYREAEAPEAAAGKVKWPGRMGGPRAEGGDWETRAVGPCRRPATHPHPRAQTSPLWPRSGRSWSSAWPCSRRRCLARWPCPPRVRSAPGRMEAQ